MKNRLGLLALLFALLVCAVLPAADGATATEAPAADKAAAKADPVWLTDFSKAKEAAKADKKIILANFTGSDWCPWCVKLEAEVFGTDAFKTWAGKHVVLLRVDFPRKAAQDEAVKKANRALAEQYGIEGFPTVLYLDAEGKKLGQTGYQKGGPEAWIKKAGELVAALKQTSALPADKSGNAAPALAAVTSAPAAAGTVPVSTGSCSATAAKTASCTASGDKAACNAATAVCATAPATETATTTTIAVTPETEVKVAAGCCGTGN